VSVEAEVGSVGYAAGAASQTTDPDEAAALVRETGVDALAVSVGNLHLQQGPSARIDLDALRAIEAAADVPLVLHGASGIPHAMRVRLARETRVSKFNVGTELRMAFGRALRDVLARDPAAFDRIAILRETVAPVRDALRPLIRAVGPNGHAANRLPGG
jgi:fructose-bisphosphate aldolase class II